MSLSPVDNPLTGPFWQAAAAGQLVVQHCHSCGEYRWPPLSGCPQCLSRDASWEPVAPSGTIWSQVTYHRAFQAELKADVPYTVAMVELDDGPYLLGRLAPGASAQIGDRVTAEFADVRGAPQLRWRPAAASTQAEHANGGTDGKA